MIGPVSGTGRAMMASLQQAMAKGMPADQAVAYVKSMAQQGVAPLTDLYAMLNQFQRLKQPQVQAPQTPPTIKDQLNMAAQQQAMQQAMAQGLGGMNAGAMENPQFAGGGIIAFADGGQTPQSNNEDFTTLDPLSSQGLIALLRQQYGGGEAAYIQREAEKNKRLREAMKLGEYGEAAAMRKQDLEAQDKERARYEAELKRANMMQFFAELGERSSKPGATFMGALAGAGGALGKSRKEAAKELSELDARRREGRLKMIEAQELLRQGDVTGARQAYAEGRKEFADIGRKQVERSEEMRGRERLVRLEGDIRRGLQEQEQTARADLEEKRGIIEERVRTNTASPADKAGLDYINKARRLGSNHPDTQKALEVYRNLKVSASSLENLIPPGTVTPSAAPAQAPGSLDFNALPD